MTPPVLFCSPPACWIIYGSDCDVITIASKQKYITSIRLFFSFVGQAEVVALLTGTVKPVSVCTLHMSVEAIFVGRAL